MIAIPLAEKINQAIRGFSILRRIDIVANENCSRYDLTLELSDTPREQSRRIGVLFSGISELRLKEFGGGLTQLLLLKVYELGKSYIEGARFEVTELERNSIYFKCESMQLFSSAD